MGQGKEKLLSNLSASCSFHVGSRNETLFPQSGLVEEEISETDISKPGQKKEIKEYTWLNVLEKMGKFVFIKNPLVNKVCSGLNEKTNENAKKLQFLKWPLEASNKRESVLQSPILKCRPS